MMNMKQMRNSKRYFLILPLLSAFGVSLSLGGCAAEKPGRTQQQQKQAETLIKNAAGLLNPTVATATELEGTWLAPCTSGSYSQGGKSAQSYTKGYIFMGNSFYKQIDYYSTDNCTWSGDESLAQGRVWAEIAAGWFSVAAGTGGLKNINMLAAPNFGSGYELNVYQVAGSGTDKTLAMGDPGLYSTTRPTSTSITFTHWDTSTYGNGS